MKAWHNKLKDKRKTCLLLVVIAFIFAGIGECLFLSFSASAASSPLNTALPAVTGSTIQGSTLTVSTGTWANSPTSYSYQWQDCIGPTCTNISGATNSTYTVQSSDIGYSLAAVVTASNSSGSSSTSSYNTAAATSSTVSNNFVSETYWLGWAPPSGCSSWDTTCLTTTTPFNWSAYNRIMLFNYGNAAPTQNATTTGSTISLGSSISSIPATVSTTIPAGPIMLTTDSSSPSSGSYQIFQTSGAASGATAIPITGSPAANANYASGSAVMVYAPNAVNWRWPNLSSLVSLAHSKGSQVWVSMGGEGDNWNVDCDNGFQYLTGAWYANFIVANDLDGFNEDNESNQTQAQFVACADAMGQEVHSVATYAGKVPGVELDWNATDNVPTNGSGLSQTIANIDAYELEYYGYNPSNDYNCANNCSGTGVGTPVTSLADGVSGGIPAEKWIDIYAPGNPDSPLGAQATPTLLSNTTSSESGTVNSIPISAVAAAGSEAAGTIPAGLVVISNTSSPATSWQYLETSGVTNCTSSCSLPITGSCATASWKTAATRCTTSADTTLNATYASGSDIWLDEIGYPQGGYNTGGWDCGTMTSWAADNNLLGSSTWYWDGTANGEICSDTIQPFITASTNTTASLTANPTNITSGSSSTLSWSSDNATSCSESNNGGDPDFENNSVATSGSQAVSPTKTTIYAISCTGTGGAAEANATVTVNAATVADINKDGTVNIFDLSYLLSSYGKNQSTCLNNANYTCDLNGDGVINIFDLSILLSAYGE